MLKICIYTIDSLNLAIELYKELETIFTDLNLLPSIKKVPVLPGTVACSF